MLWNYYKLRQLFYYKVRHVYYKLRQVLQSAINLLQISTGITKCDDYPNCDSILVSLWLSDTTQPFAQYHLLFTGTFTFSHPPNFVLLCSNVYLSLPSYVLTSRKFAKWTFLSEPELLINVMVLFSVQSPLFFRKIVENEHYRRPYWPGRAWTIVKGRGTVWEPRGPLSRYIWIQ